MNKSTIKALYKKEMMDIIRDKKTLLMMIVIPLVLYPLIFVGSMALTSSMMNADVNNVFNIAIEDFDEANIENVKDMIFTKAEEFDYDFVVVDSFSETNEDGDYVVRSKEEALESGVIDAYISRVKDENGIEEFQITYYSSNNDSSTASEMLKKVLDAYKVDRSKVKIKELGADPEEILESVKWVDNDKASTAEMVGSLVGQIIPFLLISSVLMGAMYPAIDTTAGEKERGTMETLLTLPVKNIELIVSKFFATSTIAASAAFLNVFSMGLLGGYFYENMKLTTDTNVTFSLASYVPAVIITLMCAVVFAMFSSAVCLFVCIFAGSFKEAQNYTTPVLLVFMLAGMVGMFPACELNNVTCLIPVINTSLLIGELFALEFNFGMIATVLLSNVAYCMIVVVFMANAFNSERILFSDGSESIRIIESRSNMKEKQIPAVGDILLLFSCLLIVLMFAGGVMIQKYGIYGLVIEQLLIFAVTYAYNWYIKTDMKKVFSIKAPKVTDGIGGLVAMAGYFVFMLLISVPLTKLFPSSAEQINQTFEYIWNDQPVWLLVISSALMPAVCEEFAFRGFLFGSLNNRFRPVVAILWTGLLFGLYHMSLVKLITTGLMGVLFAFVVYKTKSIFVSMMMHFANNLVAVLFSVYPEAVEKYFPFLAKELTTGALIGLLIGSIVCIVLGLLLIIKGNKTQKA